ncbi:hypothetical protein LINGRAHAP2_LOCUS8137, partial [Linum grandiflorum]
NLHRRTLSSPFLIFFHSSSSSPSSTFCFHPPFFTATATATTTSWPPPLSLSALHEKDCSSVNGGMKMVSGFTPRPRERLFGMLIVKDDGGRMGFRGWNDGEMVIMAVWRKN